jgi:hypothetical protein
MTTSIKVRKLSLVMIIFTRLCVWWGKKWKTSLYMWAPLFDAIVAMVFWSVSWVVVQSFSHEQHSKWIPKSLMVWQHWHCERCGAIRCDILRQIQSVVRKWVDDKHNEGVLRQANNQAPVVGPAHEWRRARTKSKKTSITSEINSCSCSWSIKEDCIWE